MQSQFRSPEVATPVDLRRLAGGFLSVAKQASFNIAFGVDLEGFGRPRWLLKFDVRALFFDVIFACVSVSTFGRLLDAPNLKNNSFPMEKR